MSDRTYTRFTIPMSALNDPAVAATVCACFNLRPGEFAAMCTTTPEPDESSGYEGTTVRLVDLQPCLVIEESDVNYGGIETEQQLQRAGVPYLQVNGAGDEYGPTATASDGTTSETIRLDHDLAPIVGIGVIEGRIVVDAQEVRDYERYHGLRAAILGNPVPADAAPVG